MIDTPYFLLLRWLVFTGVVLIGWVIVWDQGLLNALLAADASRLSMIIIVIFVATCAHAGWVVARLSRQLDQLRVAYEWLRGDDQSDIDIVSGQVVIGGQRSLPPGFLSDHIGNLVRKYRSGRGAQRSIADQSQLLEALSKRIKSPYQIGWVIADLMIKLGLLGTVIGFILMLRAVSQIGEFDITTLQTMLVGMSGGMRVALLTTLSGLVGGILTGLQYHMAERGAEELIAGITEITEVYVVPRLDRTPLGG
ncbi:MAG: MotA/TolQ/ExbB proton channel family protein [Gammaproteobacteria bacterium]|nr:MotA/TolQ/ExbB proton channel family protein [Gammaproteobacteria bacterium]